MSEVVALLATTGAPQAAAVATALDHVAIDGKTVRAAAARREATEANGLHLVSAYLPAMHAVETGGKGQELAATMLLLGPLPLRGRLITGDALLTQSKVCQAILDGGGDNLSPVAAAMQAAIAPTLPDADIDSVLTRSPRREHGRREWCMVVTLDSPELAAYLGASGTLVNRGHPTAALRLFTNLARACGQVPSDW